MYNTAIFFLACLYIFFLHRKIGQLREAWEKMSLEDKKLLDLLTEGVIIVEKDQVILNAAAHNILPDYELQKTALANKVHQLLAHCRKTQKPMSDSIRIEEEKKSFDLLAVPYGEKIFFVLQDTSNAQKVLDVGRDFIANASHELKTPITIIGGFTEMLQEENDLPEEITKEILAKIAKNCKRMESLIKNLLTLSDIENVPLSHLQPCDLVAIVEESRRSILLVYPDAEVEIVSSSEVIAYADPHILELAIINVLDNAIKYSSSSAKVTIGITQTEEKATFFVQDRGSGMTEEDLQHIFDRFYTVNKAHSRKLGGAGIGLSLVKTIIEKHEGTLHVTSTVGEGSTFTFSLPRS